jgi:hypothetical protein
VEVAAKVNGTGGGDAIILTPQSSLLPNTTYRFVITEGVKSTAGYAFLPRQTTFTTGNYQTSPTLPVSFEKVRLAGTGGEQYTSLAIGPDRKLYALRFDGTLKRFPLLPDGTLGAPQVIGTLRNKYGPRMAVGLAIDPASTPAAPPCGFPTARAGCSTKPPVRRQNLPADGRKPGNRNAGGRQPAPVAQRPPRQQHRFRPGEPRCSTSARAATPPRAPSTPPGNGKKPCCRRRS